MQLRDQPLVLGMLTPDVRKRVEKEASATFAVRLKTGLIAYPFILAVLWTSTDYPRNHLVVLALTSVLLVLGVAVRLHAIANHEKLYRRAPDQWYKRMALSVALLAIPLGICQAHSIGEYGFSNNDFTIVVVMIWNTLLVTDSMVSFAPNIKLQRFQLIGLLLPGLLLAISEHSWNSLQYAFGNLALLGFSTFQGKQIAAGFWQQLVNQYLEDQRTREMDVARQSAEQALKTAEEARSKAEQSAKARSEFLANMSHEIRTPMNAVMGMTNLILDQELPAETLDYVHTIRNSSDALLTIINDILDFSKIESGKFDLEHLPVCLTDCVEEVLELLAAKAAEKNIELSAKFKLEDGDWIYGDVTRLRQILLNLVGNAIKFTASGEVVVSVEVRTHKDAPETLYLAVRDTGIGIPAEILDKLFKAFTQVDSSTSRRFGGTGLGLAISKKLTRLMGGRIWVTSKLGAGSIFQFEIPYQPAPAQREALVAQENWKDKHVLVADDNETSRAIFCSYLTQWGFTARGIDSGGEALKALASRSWDAVFIDRQMPGMNGLELAEAVLAEHGQKTPPMVMLGSTAVGLPPSLAAFLVKPVRRHHVHRVLNQVFNGASAREVVAAGNRFDKTLATRCPLRILLAEDNAVNQKIAVRLLEKLGYRIDVAGNGLEVLEALRRKTYDLVLMDVQMPEMDGLEATRRIIAPWKAQGGSKLSGRPWITALTAGAMKENRDECIAAGVDDFLTKPMNMKEVEDSLQRCFQARGEREAEADGTPAALASLLSATTRKPVSVEV